MNFTRYRRPSAFLLLAVTVVLGAAAVAGLGSGGEGALVLLIELREYVPLLGWLALVAMTGAVLLGLKESLLRSPVVTTLLVVGVPMLLIGGFVSAAFGDDEEVETEAAAPGRGDRRFVVTLGGYAPTSKRPSDRRDACPRM
ncbi:hypothetical protein [Streptomyces sp. LMG1-1-1.1]|uniref:hypothetical protein n=1 Tax=Streptomyces sp. LMG1-1-1.1 TaxID=3135245 RepID=UPI00346505C9